MRAASTCSFCGREAELGPYRHVRVCGVCAKRIARLARRGDARMGSAGWPWAGARPVGAEEERISTDDVETHLDLAVAYREMGLHGDAAQEAAAAVVAASDARTLTTALDMLLTAPLLEPGGLESLRAWLMAN